MNRLLGLCFAALLAGQVCGQTTFTIDGLKYYVIEGTQNVSIVDGSGSQKDDLVIKSTVEYNGVTYTVTSIGKEAFALGGAPTSSLTIPNTVTNIGYKAFNCDKIGRAHV